MEQSIYQDVIACDNSKIGFTGTGCHGYLKDLKKSFMEGRKYGSSLIEVAFGSQ